MQCNVMHCDVISRIESLFTQDDPVRQYKLFLRSLTFDITNRKVFILVHLPSGMNWLFLGGQSPSKPETSQYARGCDL